MLRFVRIVDVSMSHGGRDECGMPTVSGPQAWVAVVSDAYRCLRDLFTLQSVASWQSLTHCRLGSLAAGLIIIIILVISYIIKCTSTD